MINYLIKKGDSFFVQRTSGFKPSKAVAVVPESFTKEDYPFLYADLEEVEGVSQWVVKLDEVAKGQAILEADKEEQKKTLRAQYIADIDAEMIRIFGTVDRDKANALYNTWYEFKKDPSFFADKGLLDDDGLPLDTASKVADFAQNKINECKSYAVFLINREKQYIDAKNAL